MLENWINPKEKMPTAGKKVMIVYKNSLYKNRIVFGHYTAKFTDQDCSDEFYEECPKDNELYVPQGWYEASYSHEDYSGYYLENQEVLFWSEIPEFSHG